MGVFEIFGWMLNAILAYGLLCICVAVVIGIFVGIGKLLGI